MEGGAVMALRKQKGQAEVEWLFGWNPYDIADDQIMLDQDADLKEAFEDRFEEARAEAAEARVRELEAKMRSLEG